MVDQVVDQIQYTDGKKIPYCEFTARQAYF
ncbi:hypothetical protein EDF66_11387 [Sphingobacterium sp. JUb20]|nr:hypothetical protein [Sphingobacterium sp. JUb21]TCQ99862.1 hypothetical protein EDF66_11387 [Sphingobacterium sp. JUb20]